MTAFKISALMVFLGVAVGCQSEKQSRTDQLGGRDPFFGERIPNPNVPTSREKARESTRDPFLRSDRTKPERDYTDIRPGSDRIGSSTGRMLNSSSNATPEQLTQELERAGARVSSPMRRDNGYEVRVQTQANSGQLSSYTGAGTSAASALRDAYDQLRTDSKR